MLDKRSKNILIIFGVALLVILLAEVFRPRPINWNPSFTSVEKIPFGSYVLFEELPDLFPEATVEKIAKDPYEFLLDSTYVSNSAYFLINDRIFLDERQTEKLLSYVSQGNTAFISARSYGYIIGDTLGVYTQGRYDVLEDPLTAQFFSETFKHDSLLKFQKGVYKTVIDEIDTLSTKALGYYDTDQEPEKELNFISVAVGKGTILFHSLPEAFGNYYMLNGNQAYASKVFSHVEADHIYWDGYLKSGRKIVESPLRFVLTQPPLKWFYYLMLFGMILFVIFRGKREQRIIEVIKPLENTSIEFTKTIGDLYFQHKDFTNIIAKKITYFMEVVRSKYYLNTQNLDDRFVTNLAQKSGHHIDETKKLIDYIKYLKGKSYHSEADLIELNKKTQDFKL